MMPCLCHLAKVIDDTSFEVVFPNMAYVFQPSSKEARGIAEELAEIP